MDFIAGETLYIDKPLKWTSFDVVNKIRLMFRNYMGIRKIKVGHAGTLDPLATGIVVVCTGRSTKKLEQLMNHDKEYVARVRFGQTTPSCDLETEPEGSYATEHITKEALEKVIAEKFTGEIEQVPPMYSAIRIDGKRAYEFARKGKTDVEMKSRKVTINSMKVESVEKSGEGTVDAVVRISCSKGTYIRSIARDLGEAMDSGAHLAALRRTAIEPADGERISEKECLTMEQVEALIKQQPPIVAEENK